MDILRDIDCEFFLITGKAMKIKQMKNYCGDSCEELLLPFRTPSLEKHLQNNVIITEDLRLALKGLIKAIQISSSVNRC